MSAEDLNALAAGQAQEALEQALAAADLDEEQRAQLSETLGEALAGAVDLSAPIAAQQAALSEAEAQLSKVQQLTLPTLPEGEDQGETILALVDRMKQEVETLSGFAQTMGGMSETVAGLKTTLTQLAQLAAGVDEGTEPGCGTAAAGHGRPASGHRCAGRSGRCPVRSHGCPH